MVTYPLAGIWSAKSMLRGLLLAKLSLWPLASLSYSTHMVPTVARLWGRLVEMSRCLVMFSTDTDEQHPGCAPAARACHDPSSGSGAGDVHSHGHAGHVHSSTCGHQIVLHNDHYDYLVRMPAQRSWLKVTSV